MEKIVWAEIENLLSNPEVVLIGLEAQKSEAVKVSSYQKELEAIEANLRHRSHEKNRVWRAFELTGDEPKFQTDIKDIMARIEELERQRLEIERRVEASEQAEVDVDGIKAFCELARRNLSDFGFEEKRLALEALRIKVWIDNEQITIEGAIPQVDTAIASTTLWRNGRNNTKTFPFRIPLTGGVK